MSRTAKVLREHGRSAVRVAVLTATCGGMAVTTVPAAGALAPATSVPVVYVLNNASGTVTPINTATNTAGAPITVGSDPWAMVVKP